MRIHNTLTKKPESFEIDTNNVVIYVCGLTPYDHTHIGHTRTYIAFDIVKRYLSYKGYKVFHIQNITDVDDKILKRCRETGADPNELTDRLHKEALELFAMLGIIRADVYPKVSEHISEIISIIQKLIDKGCAYETPTGVYFDVAKFKEYGKLSGQKLDEIKSGARVEVDETKANPVDFALWKKTHGELLEWVSPWGTGRPGWHIECSAMAGKYAPKGLDMHGGARDLIFPHHENEIAQSETANGKPFCKYWLHAGFLTVQGEKMSKSIGNFVTLQAALSKFSPNEIRLFFLQTHYRSPVDYNEEQIKAAGEAVEYLLNSSGLIKEKLEEGNFGKDSETLGKIKKEMSNFYVSMENDFDTPNALAALFNLLRLVNAHINGLTKKDLILIKDELEKIFLILGIQEEKTDITKKTKAIEDLRNGLSKESVKMGVDCWKEYPKDEKYPERLLNQIIEYREWLRSQKKYKESDGVRNKLKDIGILLEDKEGKVRWKLA